MKFYLILSAFVIGLFWCFSVEPGGASLLAKYYFLKLNVASNLIPPILIIGLFSYFSDLKNRINYNWSSTVLIITSLIVVATGIIFLLSNEVGFAGVIAIVLSSYLAYFDALIKIAFLVGAVKLFISLSPKKLEAGK